MSAKPIYEVDGKKIILDHLHKSYSVPGSPEQVVGSVAPFQSARVALNDEIGQTVWDDIRGRPDFSSGWLSGPLVAKPDQMIKRRGKLGLICVKKPFDDVVEWVEGYRNKEINIERASGCLNNFIIDPFVAHEQKDEYYVCFYSVREGDAILFCHEGGVDIGDADAKSIKEVVGIADDVSEEQINNLLANVPEERRQLLSLFVVDLFRVYRELHFTYMEINPLVVVDNVVYILDLAAKIDQTSEYLMSKEWGPISFPPPFGRDSTPEEAYIQELDSKSGASLKLTILNPEGRIWTMVAGGGASVVYSDTICGLGGTAELANYGEYSGAPTQIQTYEYAKTILSLMTKNAHPEGLGKILIIGGGIANFTNVAATFKGIIKALAEFKESLKKVNASIYVRRGGPNYQEGLRLMRELAKSIGLDMHVYGPETHMTSVVPMALENKPKKINLLSSSISLERSQGGDDDDIPVGAANVIESGKPLFTKNTRAIVYGMQKKAVQEMLDFDSSCGREKPSVAAIIYPFSGNHVTQFYWGKDVILIPVYKEMSEAFATHSDVDVLVNFASLRSAYPSTMDALDYPQIRTIAIIAEGIPEQNTKKIIQKAQEKNVVLIGPATVGGIKPGCFKIGNTGGKLDNILAARLYRPGNVAYVSRSGGMSNELNNIIARNTNGVYEGVAIGGDRYPGSTFLDHVLRYQDDENVKLIVLLGEVGGIEEYRIVDAIKEGRITKPVVAWCMGTCATLFESDVQFGHAGALANSGAETSVAKNAALKEVGCIVPETFEDLHVVIRAKYEDLVETGVIELAPEPAQPQVPFDYNWAMELGLIRKPASFLSTISDERGEELLYAGMPISNVFSEDIGIGGVVSLLWFKRRLPAYATKFIEMCLMVTADHGPAVSGAHNTIVATRAGKDLVSSLTSGLLTIGDRFGGALDNAAKQFSMATDNGWDAQEFVRKMRSSNKLIMGIGHRVKSINNPDKRVTIIKEYAKEHFPATPTLDFALEVEQVTTAKKPNLILNVDGCIAVCFVDLLRHSGAFNREEADEYVNLGVLNGIFVLGRSIGFIGHHLDQNRLKQGLYRHPWDDISYI